MLRSKTLLLPALFAAALFVGRSASADSPAPFLWQVKGPQATHYLLGSVHLLPEAADALPDGISDAYDAVEGLVFESDIGALTSPKSALSLLASAKSPRGLKAEVDASTYARVKSRVAKLGVPAPLCEQYKAWFCALTLEIFAFQKAGFSGEHGLDRQLYEAAKTDGKQIGWFESPTVHLDLFMDMDEASSKQLLAAAVSEDGASTADEPAAVFRAWRNNDTGAMEGLVTDMRKQYPLVYDRLLASRNRAWAPRLKQLLDGESSQLIVVGAAHWLGPDGLLAQLKAAGYKPKPYAASSSELITAAPLPPFLITAAATAGMKPVSR